MADFPHPARPDPPHSGVLRTVYFLALAAVAFFAVLTAVIGFYDPPDGNIDLSPGFDDTGTGSQDGDDRADYNRNVSLIMAAVSAAVFAAAVFGLGSRFNPLRAGLLLAGLSIFLTAMGFWAGSSDQWIGFLMALVNLAVLAGSILYLEEGLPVGAREPPRRLAPSDIAPTPPPPPPRPDFEPSAPPPPPNEPPPARTEPPPPMSDLPRE
ncbi:MAG: hypothetical protein ACRDQ2_16755 [Gaiellales bacterium]